MTWTRGVVQYINLGGMFSKGIFKEEDNDNDVYATYQHFWPGVSTDTFRKKINEYRKSIENKVDVRKCK